MAYALRLISRKNYTESEISKKLELKSKKLGLQSAGGEISKVLNRLKELVYVDDEKFLSDYFEYRLAAKPVGKFGFIREMKRRGISSKRAGEKWASRGISEEELAISLIEKKSQKLSNFPKDKQKKKMVSLLSGRGFSPEVIWAVLDKFKNK